MAENESPNPAPVILTRAAILNGPQLRREMVEVPEWGGAIYVRELTGAERAQMELENRDAQHQQANFPHLRAKMVTWCAIDEAGNRIFDPKDVKSLADGSAAALDRVVAVIRSLSGLGDEEGKKRAKNSSSSQS